MAEGISAGRIANGVIAGHASNGLRFVGYIDGKTGKPTTTSILIKDDKEEFLMITFDYQELKKIVEGK